MVSVNNVSGFSELENFLSNVDSKKSVYLYFTGSKLENGLSWCPDCVEAEPVVKAVLSELKKDVVFAYVDVGTREYWKDKDCPFRTDKRTKLLVIPTLIKYKGVQRLEGSQLNNRELLQMMFEDEE
ncbi:hypothetical protein JYU34_007617 [Plutella xylostella]|uniref:Uncharacterized protein n=2 Tax=Plutella xylostella TaxID=51655 RepID=A0ABQ7QQW2_PLUXY|nr:thioredoxin domain-containing protein 17 [Plutella xylostella]KAG7307429.1 hypothetical protein JYU34_007617 [Plutella xylostella]CAG9114858.1 unnamed protein product [Plutella xylostella]